MNHKKFLRGYHYLFDNAKTTDFNGEAKLYVIESRKLLSEDRRSKDYFTRFLIESQMLQLCDHWLRFVITYFDTYIEGGNIYGQPNESF